MKSLGILCLTIMFFLTGCATTSTSTATTWKLGNVKYRANGAQYARLGKIGVMTAVGKKYFDPKVTPDLTGVPVTLATEAAVDRQTKNDLAAKLKIEQPADVGGRINVILENLESGNYKIFKLADVDVLVEKLNEQPRRLDWLRRPESRMVSAVVVVYDHNHRDARQWDAGADAKVVLSGGAVDPSFTVSARGNRNQTIRIADGYNIGYEVSKAVWGPDGKLQDLRVDRIGAW